MAIIDRLILYIFEHHSLPRLIIAIIAGLLTYTAYNKFCKKSDPKKNSVQKSKNAKSKQAERDPSRKEEKEELEDSDESKQVEPLIPDDLPHIPFKHNRLTVDESLSRSEKFYKVMNSRRTLRFYSKDPVPVEIIENLIKTAGTSPSGAHTEPWTYVAVRDQEIKEKIREIVEEEEEINYGRRMGDQWTRDLKGIGTTWVKEYLTEAPWIILIFRQTYGPLPGDRRRTHYYNEISTSISAGIFISAVESAGLATLTSTPLNCGPALRTLLNRPPHEKLLLLMPVGYPAEDATVPDLQRKPLEEIMVVV